MDPFGLYRPLRRFAFAGIPQFPHFGKPREPAEFFTRQVGLQNLTSDGRPTQFADK